MKQLTIKNLRRFPLWYKGDIIVKLPKNVKGLSHSIREVPVSNPWADPDIERKFWAELDNGKTVIISRGDKIVFGGGSIKVEFDEKYFRKYALTYQTYHLGVDKYNCVYLSKYGNIADNPDGIRLRRMGEAVLRAIFFLIFSAICIVGSIFMYVIASIVVR